MRRTYPIWPWLLLLGLAGIARADEVVLKNGSKLEGTVQEDGNKVIIDVGSGTITVNRSDVLSINRPTELIQEYDKRLEAVKRDDPNGYYQVHLWARQQPGLKTRADGLLKKVLELDPNHEAARRSLGYVNHKGAWLTQEEYKAALGLVRYQGEWVSAEAAEKLRKLDQELTLAQVKRAAEDGREQQRLALEREKIAHQQRIIDMFRSGELPRDLSSALGYPALRYWGPAVAATPQPNAE